MNDQTDASVAADPVDADRRGTMRAMIAAAASLPLAARASAARAEDAADDAYQAPPRRDLPGPLRLIANENPYGPSPRARDAMLRAFDEAHRYGMGPSRELAEAIATREGVPADNIVIAAGSGEVLTAAGLAYGRNGGGIVTAATTFDMLTSYAEKAGAGIVRVPMTAAYGFDLDAIADAVTDGTRVIYLCNPNNPTGTTLPADRLRDFCRDLSRRAVVFVDEAYLELMDDPQAESMIDLVRDGLDVIVARTFSKVHGMAGLRIGYGIAKPDVIAELRKFQMTIPNTVGLRGAIASYQDTEFQAFSRAKIVEGRQLVYDVCAELGLEAVTSDGNFVMFDTGVPADAVMRRFSAEGVLLRPMADYPGYARVSIGTVENMSAFQAALRRIAAA